MTASDGPLQRSLDIVEHVALHGPCTARDLAAALSLPASTTYRLVSQLAGADYLSVHDGQVSPGLRMLGMAVELDVGAMMARLAAPLMWSLVEQTEETAVLTMTDGLAARCVESAEPRRAVRLTFRPGNLYPLHRGASAKPLLAFAAPERQAAYFSHLLTQPDGPAWVARVRGDIARIRREGVSITYGEIDPGAVGIGAAFLWRGRVMGCISVAGPADRLTDRRIMQAKAAVKDAAHQLSRHDQAGA